MIHRAPSTGDRVAASASVVLAAANILAVLLFLATLAFVSVRAAHAAAPECTGHDITAALRADDPARLEQIRREAAETPNGHGLLWKVSKDDDAPSYLFGTMHMTDPRVTSLTPEADAAFKGSRTIVIETTDVLDPSAMSAVMLKKPELMMFTDGKSLSDFLPEDEIAAVEAELKQRGVPLSSVEKMKPWVLTTLVSLPACEMARKSAGKPVLDVKLAERAKAGGKKLEGLETAAEQLDAMASIPMKVHIRGLVDTLKLGDRIDDIIETLVVLYKQGETGMFIPLMMSVSPPDSDDASGYAQFEKAMVTSRNHTMAERAVPILEEGGAFIAIGALHLPGKEGVVALLRQQGFTVTAAD